MNKTAGLLIVATALAAGCAAGSPDSPEAQSLQAPIINGTLDTTHDAVVSVWLGMGACSGTIIHKNGSSAWVLTAAHCVTPSAPQSVAQGDDYQNPDATYSVVDYEYHPAYSGPGGLYDFAVIRISGATASTPVIPAMTPAEDNLAAGTQVRHVGYGITSYPNGHTTLRHETINVINSTASSHFDYLQPTSGPCSGDSGGPALTVTGAERVAGVISGGDQTCSQYGVSGRVSAVYDSFIWPFITGAPITMTCNECFAGSTSGSGTCRPQVDACFANAACDALVTCINGCTTQGCVLGCVQANLSGYNLYRNIYDCVCSTACPAVCAGDAMCTRDLGEPCSTGAQCDSGFCVDGVCCTEACTGQCEACDRAGALGSCGAVDGDPHGDRPPCASDGSVCGGSCNGAFRSACTYPDANSPCRALSCSDGVATPLAACDGAGSCPPSQPVSCAPYLCDGDVCATFCGSGNDCAPGFSCENNTCVGVSCNDDDDCPGDLLCVGSNCVAPECTIDGDCPGDQRCVGGQCVAGDCVEDGDCASGLVCRQGQCVVPPSVSPGGCNCAGGSGTPPSAGVFGVLGLLLWLRRRQRG